MIKFSDRGGLFQNLSFMSIQEFRTIKFCSIVLAMENCLGDVGIKNGICPEFECIGPSSCRNRGKCNTKKSACECDAGFSGFDCSVDLESEKSDVYMILF